MFFAVVALQNYVVRELLAGLLLIAAVVAGLTVLVASAIIFESAWRWGKNTTAAGWQAVRSAASAVVVVGITILVASAIVLDAAWREIKPITASAWQAVRSAATVARAHLAKGILAKAFTTVSNSPQ
jgi:hypothetical protein